MVLRFDDFDLRRAMRSLVRLGGGEGEEQVVFEFRIGGDCRCRVFRRGLSVVLVAG